VRVPAKTGADPTHRQGALQAYIGAPASRPASTDMRGVAHVIPTRATPLLYAEEGPSGYVTRSRRSSPPSGASGPKIPELKAQSNSFYLVERLLYFLPAHSQPAYIRFGASALVMAVFILVQTGLQSQSAFGGLFFLLPGIFLCGILFDRGSSFFGTVLATIYAVYAAPAAPWTADLLPLGFFVGTCIVIGAVAEAFRNEMEKVVAAEKAKAVLLMELAHRTKNNLAMISAMMRLQANRADVSAADTLGDMASRIQVMAQVYDHLTIRADRKVVDAKQYITEICQHLSASISGTSPVAITARTDELYIHSEQAVPIALILNELVTNSLKYAFPDGRPGHIHVELHANGEVLLSVSDNGIGIRTQQPEGVGSRVVSLLTQQLGGTIDSENLDQGCRVTLRMPKPSI
jgi:two-component sensor histidine kinase